MSDIRDSNSAQMPTSYPHTKKGPLMLSSQKIDVSPSSSLKQEADISDSKLAFLKVILKRFSSPNQEADISPSKQAYCVPSHEVSDVDTSPSEDIDILPSKKVFTYPSEETNTFTRREVPEFDTSTSKDVDILPSKKDYTSPSEETIFLNQNDPEVDTCTSEDVDFVAIKKGKTSPSEETNILLGTDTDTLPNDGEQDKEKLGRRKSSLKCLDKGYYILVVGALVTCVASTALTIYLDVKFKHDGKTLQEPTGTSERNFSQGVCVQCIKLVQDPFNHLQADPLIDKLVKQVDDGFQMCCAENEDQMSAMVEAITREQVTKPIPRTDNENDNTGLKYVPISAHKQLLAGDDREYNVTEPYYGDGSEHFVVRLDPNYNDPLTEHAHGVTVLETALEVRHSGVYYVYFSVNLAPRPHDRLHHSVENWSQYVHRTRPNSPANSGLLLQTSHTSCSDCRNHQESAFAGGTFALKKGDLIQVCISGLGLVQFWKESSFLGIILLSHAAA